MTKPVVLFLLLAATVLAQPVLEIEAADEVHHWSINGIITEPTNQEFLCPVQPKCWVPPNYITLDSDLYQIDAWHFEATHLLQPKLLALHITNPGPETHPATVRARVWVGGCNVLPNGTTQCTGESAATSSDWRCYYPEAGVLTPPVDQTYGTKTYHWYEPQFDDSDLVGNWAWATSESAVECNQTGGSWGASSAPWCSSTAPPAVAAPAKYIYIGGQMNLYCRYTDNNQGPSIPSQVTLHHHFNEDSAWAEITFKQPEYYFGRLPVTSYDLVYKRGLNNVTCDSTSLRCGTSGPLCSKLTRTPSIVTVNPDITYNYSVVLEESYAYYMYIQANTATAAAITNTNDFIYVPPWKAPRCYHYPNDLQTGVVPGTYGNCGNAMKNQTSCTIPCNEEGYQGTVLATCWVFWSTEIPSMPADDGYFLYDNQCIEKPCGPVPDAMLTQYSTLEPTSPCRATSVPSQTRCFETCFTDHAPSTPVPNAYCYKGEWTVTGICRPQCDKYPYQINTNFDAACPALDVEAGATCDGECRTGTETPSQGTAVVATCTPVHTPLIESHDYTYSAPCNPKPCRTNPTGVVNGNWNCIETASGQVCTGTAKGWCDDNYYMDTTLEATCFEGQWTDVRGVCTPMCKDLPTIADGGFETTCIPKRYLETCGGYCDDGFVGTPSIKCGVSTPHEFDVTGDCTPKPCDSTELTLLTGEASTGCTGIVPHGTVCTGTCDQYHYGAPAATCDHGRWIGPIGQCQPQCTQQPTVDHGTFNCDLQGHVGAGCTGVCDEKYEGTPTAVCTDKTPAPASWVPTGTCTPKTCKTQPVDPAHGLFQQCVPTPSGLFCYADCDTEYNGSPSAECSFGEWLPTEGTCEPQCWTTPVSQPIGPIFSPNQCAGKHDPGFECDGVCLTGYIGAGKAVCQADHTWTYTDTCEEAPCHAPLPGYNSHWGNSITWEACDPTQSGGSCAGSCGAGYRGDATINCLKGQWISPTDSCYPQCTDAAHVDNGEPMCATALPIDALTTCDVACHDGYCGEPTVECMTTRGWSTTGACEPCACNADDLPLETTDPAVYEGLVSWERTGVATSHGSDLVGDCDTDYTGSYSAHCAFGQWTVTGKCYPQCDGEPSINIDMHGHFAPKMCGPNADVGAVCDGDCDWGYEGTIKAMCLSTHDWQVVPQCTPKNCQDPKPAAPGCHWETCNNLHNQPCMANPDQSFTGGAQVYCLFGEWQPVVGTCTPVCLNTPTIAHATFEAPCGTGHNAEFCGAACDWDYLPQAGTELGAVCIANILTQLWTAQGQCDWSPCKQADIPALPNGDWNTCDNWSWNNLCQGVCRENFKGTPAVQCLKPGVWGVVVGGCEIIDPCKPIPYVAVLPDNIKRPQACSVNASGPLVTPRLCRKPELMPADPATINMEHVEFTVQWPRWLHIVNITGTNRHDFAPFEGAPVAMNSYMFRTTYDDDWYYANAKIALKALWKMGCEIVGDPVIKCQFWAHATEDCKVGPVWFTQSIAVRFPLEITVPGNLGEISVKFQVWPKPLYDARISYFVMKSASSAAAKMIFLVMVPAPYMSIDMQLTLPTPRITAVPMAQADCDYYGTADRCFQQLEADYIPTPGAPEPCSTGGLRSYSGQYWINGGTKCAPGWTGCVDPPTPYGLWQFSFDVQTAEFCDYYLTYDATKDLVAYLKTYDIADFSHENGVFCGPDEEIYFKTYTEWLIAPPTFQISEISVVSLTVTVAGTPYDITGEFAAGGLATMLTSTPTVKYFSLLMSTSSGRTWLAPLLTPGAPVTYTFEVTLDVTYDFNGKTAKLQKTMMLQPYRDTIVSTPVASGAAAATGSSAGVIVGSVLGVVAIAAAIGGVWYFRTHRRGYTNEKLQKDRKRHT